ncbi:MAG: zf-HC2 domain-containing protein [Acidimicrobiales bacterium]
MTDPAELLSAYLDGELDPAERAQVEAYLAHAVDGRAQLDGLAQIRSALRELPSLDPPQPLVAPPVSAAGWARRAVPLLVAAAAVLLGGFLLFGRDDSSSPGAMDTGQLLALHQDAQRMMDGGVDGAPGELTMLADLSDVEHMPEDLGAGMQRMGIYGTDGLVQLVYSDGAHVVSVFEQPHDGAAPMLGEPMEVGDRQAMHQSMGGSEVLMVAEGDMVVTVVGEGGLDSLSAMAGLVVSA